MTSLPELYAALRDVIATTGLRSWDYVPGSAEWPAAFLLPPVIDYEGLTGNQLELRVDVIVLVSAAQDKHQLNVLEYVDDQGGASIPLALSLNPGLGLSDVHAFALRSRPLNFTEQAGYQAFGVVCEISVRLG